MEQARIYTRTGDDGTTGLFFGGRVSKDATGPAAYGDVDELQSVLGVARASAGARMDLAEVLLGLQRDLWIAMAELATAPENEHKLTDGVTRVTSEMVSALEPVIDRFTTQFEPIREFVVPGQTLLGAHLDVARTVARRAERSAITHLRAQGEQGSSTYVGHAIAYLNRLSDLLFTLARAADGELLKAKDVE